MKKTLHRARVSTILLMGVVLLTACGSGGKFEAGDSVLVDWNEDNWHKATLTEGCEDQPGWIVDFKDDFYDTTKEAGMVCYPESKIIDDEIPEPEDLTIGDQVLAEWVEDAYYRAEISKIQEDGISVIFAEDDFDTKVALEKIRVLVRA